MKQVTIACLFKKTALVLSLVVYLTPNLLFAQEVERGAPAERRLIRDFVLYNYAHVADNILNGKGMYLETLFSLLGIRAEEKAASLNKFLKILMENERIPDFSNSIAAYVQEE